MKTEPTETDREAARLFNANFQGLRAFLDGFGWCIVSTVRDHFRVEADALDTDDPATVGVMLAQVEAMTGEPADLWTHSRHTGVEYEVDMYNGATLGSGPTRGAALVAAMNALKGAT